MSGFALMTGIGSGLGYASYSIFGTVALRKYHTFTVIFYTFVVAVVGLLPFAGVLETLTAAAGNGTALLVGQDLGLYLRLCRIYFIPAA